MSAAGKDRQVPRPLRKDEYQIRFINKSAEKGWNDLLATSRNSMVEAWEFLTHTPLTRTSTNYPLKCKLRVISRKGESYDRWQYKPTRKGSARIWFYVDEQVVFLEQVHTNHPNETK